MTPPIQWIPITEWPIQGISDAVIVAANGTFTLVRPDSSVDARLSGATHYTLSQGMTVGELDDSFPPKSPVLTPRKWTADDVTEEDLADFTHSVTVMEWRKEAFAGLIAACWNRLEEKRSASEGGGIYLLRELEALEHNRESLVERHGLPGYRLRFPQMDDSIAEIKLRISGSGSGKSERQDALPSTDERQDPFFDADHLAEVGAYMEERARKKLLAQALEALDSVSSESQLQLDHPQFPISDKNCDLIRAVMDQLPCKGWSIGGNEAQNLRAMAQYDEDHKPEAIAALEKEVGA